MQALTDSLITHMTIMLEREGKTPVVLQAFCTHPGNSQHSADTWPYSALAIALHTNTCGLYCISMGILMTIQGK